MRAVVETAEPGVLARSFSGGTDHCPVARGRLRRAELDSLKRLVERHLDSPGLSAEFVCARSGWSRATVYRLFEADGGLAHYIRKRHLLRAWWELMSGQPQYRRILDLALAHQFSSEASFNRAFRRTFGIPPGKVRDLVAHSTRAAFPGGRDYGARAIEARSGMRRRARVLTDDPARRHPRAGDSWRAGSVPPAT